MQGSLERNEGEEIVGWKNCAVSAVLARMRWMTETTAIYIPEQLLQQGLHHQRAGQLQEAEQFFRAILAHDPLQPVANHQLGVLALGLKQPEAALPLLKTAVDAHPAVAQYWLSYLEALIVSGQLKLARKVLATAARQRIPAHALSSLKARLKAAVRAQSSVPTGLALKAIASSAKATSRPSQTEEDLLNALYDQKQYEELEASLRQMLSDFPEYCYGWKMLTALLQLQGRLQEAVPCAQRAVALLPGDAQCHNNLGVVLRGMGQLEESERSHRKAIALYQGSANLYASFAACLFDQQRYAEALDCAEQALKLDPKHTNGLVNCANALGALGRLDEAVECYEHAMLANPDSSLVLNNLAAILLQKELPAKAESYLRRSLICNPDDPDALKYLANTLVKMCREDEALACMQRVLAIEPTAIITRLQATLLMPSLMDSRQAIADWRARFAQGLAALQAEAFQLTPAHIEKCRPASFELAYHDADDRPLMEALCRFFRSKASVLNVISPHVTEWRAPGNRKIRIGVCSQFIVGHTIGKLYQGLLRHLDRSRFEIVLLHTADAKRDDFRAMVDTLVDKVLQLPVIFTEQQRMIGDEALDVLFYPDIGMGATYFLAFSRLAPIQVVSWGHPDTTGLDSIDYFVSDTGIEPEGADAHYSERLICLNRLPCFYQPINVPDEVLPRSVLGLPEQGTLYGCPQSLFKLHPDFDPILATIAIGDPNGHVVLIEGGENWVARLKKRWAITAPILNERVIFLPRQPLKRFMMLMAHFDVLLDPPNFGSGNTLYEAMVYGTPIVTWPGRFMRGRIVAGAYRQMGIADAPIAQTLADYAPLALALGRDAPRRQAFRQACVGAAQAELFSDAKAVREFELFFEAAVDAAALGRRLPRGWRPGAETGAVSTNDSSSKRMQISEIPRMLSLEQALQQAIHHHRAGRLQDAERLYRTILEVVPQHPDANHNLGVLALEVNQPETALTFFKSALDANPRLAQYWLSYIDALLRCKQFATAQKVLHLGKQQGLSGERLDLLERRLAIEQEHT